MWVLHNHGKENQETGRGGIYIHLARRVMSALAELAPKISSRTSSLVRRHLETTLYFTTTIPPQWLPLKNSRSTASSRKLRLRNWTRPTGHSCSKTTPTVSPATVLYTSKLIQFAVLVRTGHYTPIVAGCAPLKRGAPIPPCF